MIENFKICASSPNNKTLKKKLCKEQLQKIIDFFLCLVAEKISLNLGQNCVHFYVCRALFGAVSLLGAENDVMLHCSTFGNVQARFTGDCVAHDL